MATLRELITTWGFNIDFQALQKMDKELGKSRRKVARIGKEFDRFAQDMAAAGGRLTAFVTAPILGLGAGLVKVASDAEETRSKFDAVFKELSGETREWAKTTSKEVGRSKFAMEGYLAQLQDTFVPLGFGREQAAEMSKQLAVLGIDLASFNNMKDPEVINNLTSAMVGNHEAVRSFGVIITQATLKQELLNMGIAGGVQKATEQQKAMARLRIIMASTADAQGDAKRTLGQFANQQRYTIDNLRDTAAEIGVMLIPAALKLAKVIQKATEWFDNLSDGTKKNIIVIAGLTATIGPLLLILASLGIAIVGITRSVLLLRAAYTAMKWSAIKAWAASIALPAMVIAGIALLVEDIYRFVKGQDSALGELVNFWNNAWDSIGDYVSGVIDDIAAWWDRTFGPIVDGVTWLKNKAVGLVDGAIDLVGLGSGGSAQTGMAAAMASRSVVNNSRASSVRNDFKINVTVPPGTEEQQKTYLEQVADKAIKSAVAEEWNYQMRTTMAEG